MLTNKLRKFFTQSFNEKFTRKAQKSHIVVKAKSKIEVAYFEYRRLGHLKANFLRLKLGKKEDNGDYVK